MTDIRRQSVRVQSLTRWDNYSVSSVEYTPSPLCVHLRRTDDVAVIFVPSFPEYIIFA